MISGKIPFLGKLPGDIQIQKENFGFYFPLGTSILLSIILSILLASPKFRSPLGEAEGLLYLGDPVIYHGEASLSVILILYNLFKR